MLNTICGVIVRIFTNSFTNAFQKSLVEKHSSCFITTISFFILSICCIFPACSNNWMQYSTLFWHYVIIANILCALSTICLVKALESGELSILSSVNSYKCVVALIFAAFFLKELPNIYGLIGLILIVFGSWFIFDTTKEGFSFALLKRQDILLRIAAMILFGIEAVFLKKVILMSSFGVSFILWSFGGFIFSLPFLFFNTKKIDLKSVKNDFTGFVILAISTGLMQLSTNYVFSKLNVGLALALFQLSTVVNLFIGYKIFKETDIVKKFIGITIMLIGSTLILILNH